MRDFMLKIPFDLHKKLKMFAVAKDTTMTAFIIEAIKEKIQREK